MKPDVRRSASGLLLQWAAAGVALVALPASVLGEALPLLELGAGVGGLASAHYLGSDQTYQHLVPLPYVVYRGERIQADRTGLKAIVFGDSQLELSLSVNAGLPVDSDDNRAREGMPDLDWLLESGPVLRYTPFDVDGTRLRVELPMRAVFSLDDLKLEHQGWTSTPGVILSQDRGHWQFSGSLLAMFGDRDYHSYFYQVDSPYVTEDRPFHRASGGYTGSRLGLSATGRFGDWYLGGFAHYYGLQGAENGDSPLLRQDSNYTLGLMISRVLYKSPKTVSRDNR